ncbi:ABC transporter ATP-binding protein/permease [Clostridium neonatale]|uniref:ABC transporter ATP-binding protein/permease n=1 Tax=Clostridium carnis TaxID=1530 RepID=A0ABY6SRQ6_9CLOT|nr:ABC transporter ATP-binding protein/permease [Clostridium neonatale]VDG71229.1 ABC transporter ATP-binding protein/permease [Clostridium carnis]CAI3630273.1 ABC transporter ATP-binding protein/permease [Clostridium neonatale]CAI3630805.1 ABC transporter ATP-binding protein/permease [Clostridium neonatale]CAI3646797.1 ABC transporter ATP-binding protein/permease [Clostridium neonatale]
MVVALVTLVDNAYTSIAIFNVLFVQYKLDKSAYVRYVNFLNEKEVNQLFVGKRIESAKGDITISNMIIALYSRNF